MNENICEEPKVIRSLSYEEKINNIFQLIYDENTEGLSKFILDEKNEVWTIKKGDDITLLHNACILDKTYVIKTVINDTKKRLHLNNEDFSLSPEEKTKNEKIFKDFINAKTQADCLTALHYASFRGNIKAIKLLISNYADINALTNTGLNMIHKAAQGNKPSAIIYFNKKYNMNLKVTENDKHLNSLQLATISGMENSVIFLLYLGLNPNYQDKNGYTALHYAVKFNQIRIIKKLMQYGANKDINNIHNKSPFMLAKNKPEILEIFRKKNICEKLFFRPDITKKTIYSNQNVLFFIILYILIFILSFSFLLPYFEDTIASILYIFIYFFAIILYIFLLLSNPGTIINNRYKDLLDIVEKGNEVENYCPYCLVRKKFKSLHCLICEKCIEEFDHHCFWVGNCIGKNNYPLFFTFFMYLIINILFNIGIIFFYLIIEIFCNNNQKKEKNTFPGYLFNKDSIVYNKIVKIIVLLFINVIYISFSFPLICLYKKHIFNLLEKIKKRIEEDDSDRKR